MRANTPGEVHMLIKKCIEGSRTPEQFEACRRMINLSRWEFGSLANLLLLKECQTLITRYSTTE